MDNKALKTACTKARAKVLSHFPQLSPIILGLPYQIVKGCPTAFVTKHGMVGMGDEYIKKYTNPNLAACFMHEGFHMMLDHLGRVGARDPKVWNIAADIVINETLRRMTLTLRDAIDPDKDMIYPETYGFTWVGTGSIPTVDSVYEAIKNGKNKPKAGTKEQGGHGEGCGSGSGGMPHPGEGQLKEDLTGSSAAMSEETKAKIELAAQSIGSMLKSIGVGSAEFEMWANAIVKKPKFDPMRELRNAVGMALASARGRYVEPTFHKVNRRGFDYLPGRQHFTPEVTVISDTSGSMFGGEDGDNTLTEIAGLLMKLGRVRVITCDTDVTFDGYITSIAEFKRRAKGGGGTELTPAFEAAKGAKALVCLTDGYLGRPACDNVDSTIFLLTGKNSTKLSWMKRAIQLAKD